MTALQVLMTMGNICGDQFRKNHSCSQCPMRFVNEPTRMGCAYDFLYDRKIARQVIAICKKVREEE